MSVFEFFYSAAIKIFSNHLQTVWVANKPFFIYTDLLRIEN